MRVNAFWFGLLIGMIFLLMFLAVLAHIANKREERKWEEISKEEARKLMSELSGKKFQVMEKDGELIAVPVEEEENADVQVQEQV